MSALFDNAMQFMEWVEKNTHHKVKDYWSMGSPWPILFIVSFYLYFVLKWGPAYMKNRNPFNIDRIVMVYNAVQVLFSFYLVKEAFRLLWLRNDYRFMCIEVDYSDTESAGNVAFTAYMFLFAKFLDLLDTVFFVLRKKQSQVTFLHVYHHTMVILLGWIVTNFFPGGQVAFFGTINAAVHCVMYSYYLLSIINPAYKYVWWKRYLTIVQLVQFVITGIHAFSVLFVTDCNYPKLIIALGLPQDALMFYLFWNFYQKTYVEPQKNKQS